MATLYKALLPEILPECPGLPEIIAINEARNAVRYFCEESTYWRYDIPLISTVTDETGIGEYTLSPPANTQIVSVISPIQHNDLNVVSKTKFWLDVNEVKWRSQTNHQSKYFTMLSTLVLRLVGYPVIAQPNALRVSVALKPSKTSTDFDDELFNEYAEYIACIAKGELLLMPNKEWSDKELGVYYKQRGQDAIVDALSKRTSGFIKGKADRNNKVTAHFF